VKIYRTRSGRCRNCPTTSEGPFPEGPACQVRPCRRDLPVGSVFVGGTCLSGLLVNIGPSIAFRRGLKSRAESGAKAPHSIWRPLVKIGPSISPSSCGHDKRAPPKFNGRRGRRSPNRIEGPVPPRPWRFPVLCRDHEDCPPVGAIHELPLPTLTSYAQVTWGTMSVALRLSEKPFSTGRAWEGHACHVRLFNTPLQHITKNTFLTTRLLPRARCEFFHTSEARHQPLSRRRMASRSNTHPPHAPPLTAWRIAHSWVSWESRGSGRSCG